MWVIATDLAGNRSANGPYSLEVTCLPAAPTIASILVEPASGVTGTVTITARLNNTGGELPAGLLVGFFANGVPVATAAAPALAAGQGVTLTVAWPDVYGGDFDLRVVPNVPSTSGSRLPLCAAPESLNRTVSTQDLVLNSAWNLISTNINPQNPDITVVQRPISGTYATIQSFDQGALSYYPQVPAPLNTLRTIDALHGYWIRVTASPPVTTTLEAARLLVVGEAVPDTTPLALDAGWNLISYLPRSSRTVSEALTNINGYYSAVMGFRGGALSYYPDLPPEINSLKSLEPGYGYWLKTSQAITLVYSATVPGGLVVESAAGIGRGPQIAALAAVQNLRTTEAANEVLPTSTWMNYYGPANLSDGKSLPSGVVLLAVDPQGTVCGAVPYTRGGWYGLLACYGDDPTTPIDEGALAGDAIEVRAIIDGQVQVIGTGLWTAHGDRQQVPGGEPPPVEPPTEPPTMRTWLPLILNAGQD